MCSGLLRTGIGHVRFLKSPLVPEKRHFESIFCIPRDHKIPPHEKMRCVEKVLRVSEHNNGSNMSATSAGPDGIEPVPLGTAYRFSERQNADLDVRGLAGSGSARCLLTRG